ncbi:hypothetical protein [Paenibacillus marinisediminis]
MIIRKFAVIQLRKRQPSRVIAYVEAESAPEAVRISHKQFPFQKDIVVEQVSFRYAYEDDAVSGQSQNELNPIELVEPPNTGKHKLLFAIGVAIGTVAVYSFMQLL